MPEFEFSLLARGGPMMWVILAMAVLTTLYGLLLANLVLAPLARAIDRVAGEEEADRQEIVDWLAAQVADEMPGRRAAHHPAALLDATA